MRLAETTTTVTKSGLLIFATSNLPGPALRIHNPAYGSFGIGNRKDRGTNHQGRKEEAKKKKKKLQT